MRRAQAGRIVSLGSLTSNARASDHDELDGAVWIVEDEPAAAELAADLCEAGGTRAAIFRSPMPFLSALRGDATPAAVVLDWRLEHELSAAIFLATRHRFPALPVIYWTGNDREALPAMIRNDRLTRVVDKAGGTVAFDEALRWALREPGTAEDGRS